MTRIIPSMLFLERTTFNQMLGTLFPMKHLDFVIVIDRDPATQEIFAFDVIKNRYDSTIGRITIPVAKNLMAKLKKYYGVTVLDV